MTRRKILPDRRSALSKSALFLAAAALQIGCGGIFLVDVLLELDEPFRVYWAEALGVLALAVGSAIILHAYFDLRRRTRWIERQLAAATGAFQEVVEEHFAQWGLTEAERDVALLAIKGVPTAEIAGMRNTREGTIKAQNAAIYRKAGVSGRAELISLFVEELTAGLGPSGAKG